MDWPRDFGRDCNLARLRGPSYRRIFCNFGTARRNCGMTAMVIGVLVSFSMLKYCFSLVHRYHFKVEEHDQVEACVIAVTAIP